MRSRHTGHGLLVAALAAGFTVAAAATSAAEPLGRLFFTPQQRAELDRLRGQKVREVKRVEGATLSVDGVVRGPGGRTTVWVNGAPHRGSERSAGIAAIVDPAESGRVTVLAGDDRPASLRVGESINRATLERSTGLGAGSVQVTPR